MTTTARKVAAENLIMISETSPRSTVTIRDGQLERLKMLHAMGMSWREIARLDDYKPIPAGSLCRFVKDGYLAPKWCIRLSIPLDSKVQVIFGVVPDGSQVIGAELCACGQWYISNHPARKHCFICRPWKGKSKGV